MVGALGHFSEREVYRDAFRLAVSVCECSKLFPPEERYSLTAQLRRAGRSVGAKIAEAWGKRKYPRSFAAKLSDAEAELYETEHWMACAYKHGYVSKETFQRFRLDSAQIVQRLGVLMAKPGVLRRRSELLGLRDRPGGAELRVSFP